MITDPEGKIIMEGPWPSLDEEPGVEVWGPAEKEGTEGHATLDNDRETEVAGERPKEKKAWQQKKVFNDICKHTAASFPPLAREQWAALKHFHETNTCSDTVPAVPFHMEGETRTWPIAHGSPIDWKACWGKLAWRFPRTHHAPDTLAPTTQTAQADVTPTEPTLPPRQLTANELLLANGITGAGESQAMYNAAINERNRTNVARTLGQHLESVIEGGLYFVKLQPGVSEGEFQVGLARAMESKSSSTERAAKDVAVRVKWYARNEWLARDHRWLWSKTPSFKPARVTGTNRIWYSPEPLTCFIPITVQLTPASLQPGKEESPRVLSECVSLLREVCTQRSLVNVLVRGEAEGEMGEGSGAQGGEEGEEEEEGEEGEEVPKHSKLYVY